MKRLWTVLFMMTICLSGCGSSKTSYAYDADSSAEYVPAMAQETSAAYGGADMYYETADTEEEKSSADVISGEKLVYTGNLTLETLNYEDTVSKIHKNIQQFGGIIESESQSDNDTSWYRNTSYRAMRYMNATVRIPTENFDAFMNCLDGDGKVTYRSQNVQNITRAYNDNAIEIESLQTQEKRLLEMMEQAESVDDLITIEARLSDVQTKLNQKKSYQADMDTDVRYSTVYINVDEVKEYTETDSNDLKIDGFGKELEETFQWACKFFVYLLEAIVLFVIRAIPVAIIILILFAIIRLLCKYIKLPALRNPFRKKKTEADHAN